MKAKTLVIIIILLFCGFLLGHNTASFVYKEQRQGYKPSLNITGDVKNILYVKSIEEFSLQEFVYKNEEYQGIYLKDLIHKAEPMGKPYNVLLIGDDGLVAEIPGNNLKGCYVTFSAENAWEAVNLYHPVSSNIKRISKIVVVSKANINNYGLSIITPEKNLLHMTPGQLYEKNFKNILYFEGSSRLDNNGETFETSIYTQRKVFKLEELVQDKPFTNMLVFGEKGLYRYIKNEGYIELDNNTVNYLTLDRKEEIKNIKGILLDPPAPRVMDVYYDAVHYLKNNEKVLIVFVDGFGYHQYQHAVNNGYAPTLEKLPQAVQAVSVYKPVTNAGFAAMITGKPPEENGVYSRDQKDLKVSTIFDEADKLGKKSVIIEGNIKILNTRIDPILNIDTNSNGSCDDEIFKKAVEEMKLEPDLIMVHFHGVDDSGHDYGDLSPNTLKTIKQTDKYIKGLMSNWPGKVIIISDHGMHSTQEGGDHGSILYQDLIVPYILVDNTDIK